MVKQVVLGVLLGAISGSVLPVVLGYGIDDTEFLISTVIFALIGGIVGGLSKSWGRNTVWLFLAFLALHILLVFCSCTTMFIS